MFCAVFFVVLLHALPVHAGAWTQEKGHGLIIIAATATRASTGFDAFGGVEDIPKFRKEDYELYSEYGLRDRLTAIAHLRYSNIHPEPPSIDLAGLAEAEFGLRYRLYAKQRNVISVEASLFAPGKADLTSGGFDGEIRLNTGSVYKFRRLRGFIDTGIAYRGRTNRYRDEIRADATIGLDLSKRWQLLAQSFTVLTIGPGRTTAFQGQMSKAELSLLYRVSDHWAMQLGGLATVTGTGVPRERGAVAALWYKF